MVSISDEMAKKLEEERKKRLLDTIPETIRVILSEYLSRKS
jgi:hypothetical protein